MGPFSLGAEYGKFWAGYGLIGVADNVGATALSIILLQRTGSAVAVSLGLMLQLLPAAIVGPFAGLMLDRLNRKAVMPVVGAVKAEASRQLHRCWRRTWLLCASAGPTSAG